MEGKSKVSEVLAGQSFEEKRKVAGERVEILRIREEVAKPTAKMKIQEVYDN